MNSFKWAPSLWAQTQVLAVSTVYRSSERSDGSLGVGRAGPGRTEPSQKERVRGGRREERERREREGDMDMGSGD